MPEFTGVRVLDDFPLATLREFIDWTPFFHTWGLKGVYPRILEDAEQGAQARQIFAEAQCAAGPDHRGEADHGARRVWVVSGERRGRRCGAVHGRARGEGAGAVPFSAPAGGPGGQRAVPVAGGLYCAEGDGAARSHWRVRGDERDRAEGAVRRVPGGARRLQRDHGGGDCRPAGGGVCRVPAQAGARRVGLWARRGAEHRGADPGEVSRDPAGGGLSGVPGSHGEGHAVAAAGCGGEDGDAD